MRTASTDTPFLDDGTLIPDGSATIIESPIIAVFDASDLAFDLGVWLAGLTSFLKTGGQAFEEKGPAVELARDWRREFRLTRTALLNCARLNFRLRRAIDDGSGSVSDITSRELDTLTLVLRDAIVLNENALAAANVTFAEWRTWSEALATQLATSEVPAKLTGRMQNEGGKFLPEKLTNLIAERPTTFAADVDLNIILPRFGLLLGALNVVGNMIRRDEPLKPALLIFSWVHEQTSGLIAYMNNRLSRFPAEDAAMFDSLDTASYTASLELKKVYAQELSGLAGVRPVPSVFSRVETAYELLSDSFRQILTGFARVADPDVLAAVLFPTFQTKLDESIALRSHLWRVLQAVQAAEQNPDNDLLETLNTALRDFLDKTVDFLFHKDKETLERFAEEIFATSERHDIVPLLHRFGAYVETLLSQVNMRTVLADYPFDPAQN